VFVERAQHVSRVVSDYESARNEPPRPPAATLYYLLVDGGLDHREVGIVLGRPTRRDELVGRDLDG